MSPFHLTSDCGVLVPNRPVKCTDSISTDVDYQAEKGPLECRCCLEDFPEPDAGSQQAESSNFSSELFAKFLRHLELAELEVAARLSFLCNLAYMIEEIEVFLGICQAYSWRIAFFFCSL